MKNVEQHNSVITGTFTLTYTMEARDPRDVDYWKNKTLEFETQFWDFFIKRFYRKIEKQNLAKTQHVRVKEKILVHLGSWWHKKCV